MEMSLKHKNQDAVLQAFQRESHRSLIYSSRTIIHAKLEMTEPGDHDEQETMLTHKNKTSIQLINPCTPP